MRLIDADALFPTGGILIKDNDAVGAVSKVVEMIQNAPTISPDSLVKRGRWDDSGTCRFEDGSIAIRCSECGAALTFDEYTKYHWNYCPNCGALMED